MSRTFITGDIRGDAKGDYHIFADGGEWLKCDGSLVSRKRYPVLYSCVGTRFTDEDERCCTSELFALPNLQERP